MDKIGKMVSPVLEEIEAALWTYDSFSVDPPEYTMGGFRASIRIFSSALMERLWVLQEKEEMDLEDRLAMAERCGQDIRNLVKVYADIDTKTIYE